MTKDIKEYYESFPSVLKEALKSNTVDFEKYISKEGLNIEDCFEPFFLYRRMHRIPGDTDYTIKREDFFSQVEDGNYLKARGTDSFQFFSNLGNYSCSFSRTREFLEQIFNFSKPQNKLLYGQLENRFGIIGYIDEEPHVHCWIFKDQDLTKNFKLIE